MTTDVPKNHDITNDKKHKKHKNKRIRAIQEQMEFYFSDANLARDRFLANLLAEASDGQVELSVFMTFNKMKAFDTNIEEIASALTKSALLQVSSDGKFVKRLTSVNRNENVDKCTIYVENIPQNADHEWIKEKFKQFGKVAYVSLPKFKHSKRIKGFAFVEFENEVAAEAAWKAFTKAADLLVSENQIKSSDSKSTVSDKVDIKTDENDEPAKKKRKIEVTPDIELEGVSYLNKSIGKKPLKKNKKPVEKKHRENETPSLRVLSKLEWKRYRNKYLTWQKVNMAQLKKNLALHQESQKCFEEEPVAEEKTANKMPEFTPGVIIKLTFNEPVIKDAKELRNEIKSHIGVRYVELKEEAISCYIRCDCPEITKNALESVKDRGEAVILEGEEEKAYWDKIAQDRTKKLNNKQRPKRRGFDKIIRKAVIFNTSKVATHIRFDE